MSSNRVRHTIVVSSECYQFYSNLSVYYNVAMKNQKPLQTIDKIEQMPTPYETRSCTDVLCIAVYALFSFTLLLVAYLMSDYDNYYKANFPTDSQGRLCGIDDATKLYPYLYFVDAPNMAGRLCVRKCPSPGHRSLDCVPTSKIGCRFTDTKGFEVVYYPTQPQNSRSGYFCMPEDGELREQLLEKSNLKQRQELYNSLDLLKLSFLVTIGLSILYTLAVQLYPRVMNYAAVGMGCAVMLGAIICLATYKTQHVWNKVLGIVALTLLVITIAITSYRGYYSWRMHAVFLSAATKMVAQRKSTLLYILLFQVILCAFVVLSYIEFAIISASGQPTFDAEQSVFYQPRGSSLAPLYTLLFFQTVWGLSLIKSAANFCVAGQAVLWQSKQDLGFWYPVKLMVAKHLGSVIASAFMNGFVSVFDFIFDTIKLTDSDDSTLVGRVYGTCCSPCLQVFELVREDAVAYINLTGNPYCNSSRYCEYLCRRSKLLDYSQSTSRIYRISAHASITGVILILALYLKGHISVNVLFIIGLIALFTCTTFVSFHADISQAIQIIVLSKEEFMSQDQPVQNNIEGGIELLQYLGKMQMEPVLAKQIALERTMQLERRQKAAHGPNN